MKTIQKTITRVAAFLIICTTAMPQTWEFVNKPSDYPPVDNEYQYRDEWDVSSIHSYKDYLVFLRPYHGFALLKDKVWDYYEPERIIANLENKTECNFQSLNIALFTNCQETKSGYLWLSTKYQALRFDGKKFKCFDKIKPKDSKIEDIFYISQLIFNGENVYALLGYRVPLIPGTNLSDGWTARYVYAKFDHQNEIFVEMKDETTINQILYAPKIYINSQNKVFYENKLKNPKIYEGSKPSRYISANNDTVYKVYPYPALYIDKFYNGELVGYDSTLTKIYNELYSSLSKEEKIKYLIGSFEVAFANTSLYVLVNFSSKIDPDQIASALSRIYKYDISSGKVIHYEVPRIPGDTNIRTIDGLIVKSNGDLAINHSNIGTYNFYPNVSSVEEDYMDDGFLVGARIWKLYPNPVKIKSRAEFHLSHVGSKNVKIQIIDILGKVHKDLTKDLQYNYKMREGVVEFTTDDLANGIYYFVIHSPNANDIRQIIIQR